MIVDEREKLINIVLKKSCKEKNINLAYTVIITRSQDL